MEPIKVILADDHVLLRHSLASTLSAVEGITVIGEAENGAELVALCLKSPPDVAVVDIRMPVMNGIDAAKLIRERLPEVKILVLTTFNDDLYIRELFGAGVDGYILKSSEDILLANAVKSVYMGIHALDKEVIAKISGLLSKQQESAPRGNAKKDGAALSPIEHRVAELLAQGAYNKDIARELDVSYGRVRNIVSEIYRKLALSERSDVAHYMGARPETDGNDKL